jgi:hypothetical protein
LGRHDLGFFTGAFVLFLAFALTFFATFFALFFLRAGAARFSLV